MITPPSIDASSGTTRTQHLLAAARYYLGGRRLLIVATVAIVAGLALNWSWLVAAGIAPVLAQYAALPGHVRARPLHAPHGRQGLFWKARKCECGPDDRGA